MLLELERRPATLEEFNSLEEGAPYELIGGELVMVPAPTPYHQRMSNKLLVALTNFVEPRRLGWVFDAPLNIRFTDEDVYQPDIVFVRMNRVHLIGRKKFNIVPDLVVEVLSPSNLYDDFARKREMYCAGGVEEFWILDPINETIEILVNEGTSFRTNALLRAPQLLESAMFPGFSMKIEDVFAF